MVKGYDGRLDGRLDFRLDAEHRERFSVLVNQAEMRLSDALRLLVVDAIRFPSLEDYRQCLQEFHSMAEQES